MGPLAGAAGIMAGGDILSGLFAPSPTSGSNINLTRGGANSFQGQIQPLLETLMKGGNAPDIQNLMKFFDQGEKNLYGAQQRSMGMAGAEAGASSLAHGYNNPLAAINLGMGKVGGQYAGQFGQLQDARAQSLFGANRSLLGQLLGLTQGNVGMGANPGNPSAPSTALTEEQKHFMAQGLRGSNTYNPSDPFGNGRKQQNMFGG